MDNVFVEMDIISIKINVLNLHAHQIKLGILILEDVFLFALQIVIIMDSLVYAIKTMKKILIINVWKSVNKMKKESIMNVFVRVDLEKIIQDFVFISFAL